MTESFKEYLDLRFTDESSFEKELLLRIRDQIGAGKFIIKSVHLCSPNGNGKTELINHLIKGSKIEIISLNSSEIDGKSFYSFRELKEYAENNDNFILILSYKFITSNQELYESSFKYLHDTFLISKKKNILIIFEDYMLPFTESDKYEKIFRFHDKFDICITLRELPPVEYKKYFLNSNLKIEGKTLDFILKHTRFMDVSNFHSFLLLLKSMHSGSIDESLVRSVLVFLRMQNTLDDSSALGLSSIVGREELINALYKIVVLFRRKKQLEQMGINRVLCFIFAGPPGTGKTFAVRCLSNELGIDINHVNMLRIESEGKNHSESLHNIFKSAAHGKGKILFIDEAEKLLGKNSFTMGDGPLQGELQQLIDGVDDFHKKFKGIVILNVNNINQFSGPLLDRFKIINFSVPEAEDRKKYIEFKSSLLDTQLRNCIFEQVDVDKLVKMTDGCSYREIERLWADLIISHLQNGSIENALSNKGKQIKVEYFG